MQTLTGERKGSLLGAIDRTVTGAGARLLSARLAAPLTEVAADRAPARHGGSSSPTTAGAATVREALRACPDVERALSRLSLERGGPRDLAQVRDCPGPVPVLRNALALSGLDAPPPVWRRCAGDLASIRCWWSG